MSMATVRVTPGMLPPTMSTTPNSPTVWAKLKAVPVINPGTESGSTTRGKGAERRSSESGRRRHQFAVEGREGSRERLHRKWQAIEDRADHQAGECESQRVAGERHQRPNR